MQGFSGGFAELAAFAKRTEAELIKVKSNTLNFDASHLVLQTLTPALGAYVGALERQENARRLTLTAIGIKQFQLKQQRWPTSLGELDQVELGPADWTLLKHGSLGYEATDEEVVVWGAND